LTSRLKNGLLPADDGMSQPKHKLDDLRIERPATRAPRSNIWLAVVLVFVGLLALGGVWSRLRAGAVEVRTSLAREAGGGGGAGGGSERTVLNASGYVTARRRATVSAKVTGKVVEVLVEEGMKVQEGQILARLDDTNVRANLLLAEAQLDSARIGLEETQALLKQADHDYLRSTNLLADKLVSISDYDKAEANAASLRGRLARQARDVTVAERQVAVWQQQMEDNIIRAPFSGIVTTKDAQPGEMISPVSAGGGFTRTGICTIVDMGSLEIEIDVNESYINRVEPIQPVEATLDAYPDWKIPCKVIAIIPTADRQKSTVKVRVGFDQLDKRVLPDMSVKVAFHEMAGATNAPIATRAVIVPKGALRQKDGRDFVLVVQSGRVERRAVTVTAARDEEVTLGAGVNSGERVVVGDQPELTDGSAVKEKKL
jgi:RND family efflux transporter MFP subunit